MRMFQEEGLYFVTSRCFQGRLLLRPSTEMNEVVGGVLARAVQHSAGTVRLHAFTFASNHFHLLVWARGAALASFMQYLRSNLSKKVGRLVDWSGSFWERRYSAEPVLDDTALVGRLRYVLAHGVKEGLVERSVEWPGLTCLPQLLGSARRVFQWFNVRTMLARCDPPGSTGTQSVADATSMPRPQARRARHARGDDLPDHLRRGRHELCCVRK
ncbi:transposase [Archangium violaceum]|uniref:transposase n=1 Tax=Archangium violaceum TaxID=83451 RepID=UPI0037C14CC8